MARKASLTPTLPPAPILTWISGEGRSACNDCLNGWVNGTNGTKILPPQYYNSDPALRDVTGGDSRIKQMPCAMCPGLNRILPLTNTLKPEPEAAAPARATALAPQVERAPVCVRAYLVTPVLTVPRASHVP